MGMPRLPSLKFVSFCGQNGCIGLSTLTDVLVACADPFSGQTLSLAQAPAISVLYFVKTKSGKKKLSGFLGELFYYLAKAFGFKPKFILNLSDGQYIQRNQSFASGKLNEVSEIV